MIICYRSPAKEYRMIRITKKQDGIYLIDIQKCLIWLHEKQYTYKI